MSALTPEEQAALERWRTRRAAYSAVFDSPMGEVVLDDLMRFCQVDGQAHAPGDPYQTAFNDGARRPALYVRQILNDTEPQFMRRLQSVALPDD